MFDEHGDLVRLTPNIPPGSRLPIGASRIRYTQLNEEGDTETVCSFYVNVQTESYVCANTPSPNNGRIVCHNINQMYQCGVECDFGYIAYSGYDSLHTCRTPGWDPPFPEDFESMACILMEAKRMKVSLVATFAESCIGPSMQFKQAFIDVLSSKFSENSALCGENGIDICNKDNYELECISGSQRSRRQTGSTRLIIVTEVSERHQMLVKSTVQKMKDILNSGNKQVVVLGRTFTHQDVTYDKETPVCRQNTIQYSDVCLVCSEGTTYSPNSHTCQPCPANYYQEIVGGTKCLPCPEVSPAGSYSYYQCITRLSTLEPVSDTDDDNKWIIGLIVGLCCAAVLVLIVIIYACMTCCRVCKTKKAKLVIDQERGAKLKGNISLIDVPMRPQSGAYTNDAHVAHQWDDPADSSLPRYVDVVRNTESVRTSETPLVLSYPPPSPTLHHSNAATAEIAMPASLLNYDYGSVVSPSEVTIEHRSVSPEPRVLVGEQPGLVPYSPNGFVGLRPEQPIRVTHHPRRSPGPQDQVDFVRAPNGIDANRLPADYRRLPSGQLVRIMPQGVVPIYATPAPRSYRVPRPKRVNKKKYKVKSSGRSQQNGNQGRRPQSTSTVYAIPSGWTGLRTSDKTAH